MSGDLELLVGAWLVMVSVAVFVVRRRGDAAADNRIRRALSMHEKHQPFAVTRVDLLVKVGVLAGVGLVLLVRGLLGD